jgi:hypothetical protein
MTLNLKGKVSYFGGPADLGVSASEGLAFIFSVDAAPWLFLESQPAGTTGLARRLCPNVPYIACRWDYDEYPKDMLASMDYLALVIAPQTGRQMLAYPADWGPHENTGRVADISPGLMQYLGIETDDEVEVIFPYEPEIA